MGGNLTQVTVISKLTALPQRHGSTSRWHSSQVEGLVRVNLVQVQVLSPALQSGQGVTEKPE
jgi:hypothetical protein